MKLSVKLAICILLLLSMLASFACAPDVNGDNTDTSAPDGTDGGEETAEVKEFPLIEDKKSVYRIVKPENGSAASNQAAAMIYTHLIENGIRSELKGDWNKNEIGSDIKEILVGNTAYTPELDLGFELSTLGAGGFTVKAVGNKILLLAGSDFALPYAARHLIDNFLDIEGGKTTMPENYSYVLSKGSFLTEFTLGGIDISKYAIVSDFDGSAEALRRLIKEKCGVTLSDGGAHKIILTSKGASADIITAKFENGDLILRAKDEAAMQKAIVCFWFENIGHESSSLALPSDLNYSRDLSKTVFYSDFGVKQSDNECCMDALIAAHNYANENGFKVFADLDAKYYISSVGKTVTVKTDAEWGNAEFVIDDSSVTPEQRGNWIFTIPSSYSAYSLSTVTTIDRESSNIGITLPQKSIVSVYDANTTHYVRYGGNADNGQTKVDTAVVDTDGSVDMSAPFMWDFDTVTSVRVLPIDETVITVSGGIFTTIANQAPSEYTYYARGFSITRSNTNLKNITHNIVGEGDHGAPYNGFFSINSCAYVTVENCVLTGHKTYQSPTTAMGSYDIGASNAISVTFKNCSQTNDISDTAYWGIMGANYIKNIVYDGCVLSRFDAHKGVANATIKNSVIGHGGASVVGYGTLLIENSAFYANQIIDLRSDYGSTWEGDVIIKNCVFNPSATSSISIIRGSNGESHDFGYVCYAPENVTIDGLTVYSSSQVYVFGDLAPNHTSENSSNEFPYVASKSVSVKSFSSNSSKAILLSPNTNLFRETIFTVE